MATAKKMRAKSIGHYILGKTIGEGTFGKVKLGTHILTGEKVAVKILEKDRIVDVADVERVAREIHILKLIQHPHVIQLYEIIETPRQLYLIMEYCSGGELFDHIVASGRVRERDACRFFHHIIAGVEQIHRMCVVHRDLKPENLLLDEHKNVKIVDFGLSNTFRDGQLLKTACGSPCYAAPEMIAGNRYVPSLCDLWSCGVILFALVCGYLPFEDQNTANLYKKILNAEYKAPKFTSDSVREFISKMLTTDPEHRYTIAKIRQHVWYSQIPEASIRWEGNGGERVLEEDVLEQLDRYGFPRDYAVKCLQVNKHNHATTTYHLLCEKKRRLGGMVPSLNQPYDLAMGGDFSGGHNSIHANREVELIAEATSPTPDVLGTDMIGNAFEQKGEAERGTFEQPKFNAEADRGAGGASPMPTSARQEKPPESPINPSYGQWAQALGLPSSAPFSSRDGVGTTPRTAEYTMQNIAQYPPGRGASQSACGHYNDHPVPSGRVSISAGQTSPRRRSAGQPNTPRGSMPTPPPLNQSSATPRSTNGGRTEGPAMSTPTGVRTSTPGRRPPPANLSVASRPGTSQGMATPSLPTGSLSARGPNEARRRQYIGSSEGPPGSARGVGRPGTSAGSGHAAVTALNAEVRGRPVVNGPVPAWASRPSTSNAPSYGSAARAFSACDDMSPPAPVDAQQANAIGATTNAPLSARDARDEVMKTCRGNFNVSCTSSKPPKQILQEIHRALTLQRVSYKQVSGFLVKCQRQNLRFEMEISHLDHLESIYVVRFKRVAGELVAYKDLCSKILAEMKM